MNANITIRHAQETNEGDAVQVKRLFPIPSFMNFDPFMLWDHFDVEPGSGFPDHPHRGFEGVTYMLNGSMEHKDNLGNQSRVEPGGVQRFTAGSGIVHSEMPGTEGSNKGIQLWVNLPQRLKGLDPDYQQVDQCDLPVQEFTGGYLRTLVGDGSPLKIRTPVIYKHLELQAGGEYTQILESGFRGLVYVINGDMVLSTHVLAMGDAAFVENTSSITLSTEQGCSVMICFGQPHNEPVRQHGPFVD